MKAQESSSFSTSIVVVVVSIKNKNRSWKRSDNSEVSPILEVNQIARPHVQGVVLAFSPNLIAIGNPKLNEPCSIIVPCAGLCQVTHLLFLLNFLESEKDLPCT